MTADLKKVVEVADQYGALTYVDDSHSVGVMGKYGMGLASHRKGVDVVFGSFGKQSGTFGAYLATNQLFRSYLLAFNSELLEITMIPPAGLGAISGSLDLIPDMHVERQKVDMLSHTLRELLANNHWDIGNGTSHIVPLICSKESECLKLSNALLKANIFGHNSPPSSCPPGSNAPLLHGECIAHPRGYQSFSRNSPKPPRRTQPLCCVGRNVLLFWKILPCQRGK